MNGEEVRLSQLGTCTAHHRPPWEAAAQSGTGHLVIHTERWALCVLFILLHGSLPCSTLTPETLSGP